LDLSRAIKEGTVQGLKIGNARAKAWTSKVALDAYIAAQTPTPEPEPEAPIPQDTVTLAALVAEDVLGKMATLLVPLHDRLGQIESRLAALEARPVATSSDLAEIREAVREIESVKVVVTRRNPAKSDT
jgi:hypothetical protein